MEHRAQARLLFGEAAQQVGAVVAAAVVHHDDLVVEAARRGDGARLRDERADGGRVVVAGEEDAQARRVHRASATAAKNIGTKSTGARRRVAGK